MTTKPKPYVEPATFTVTFTTRELVLIRVAVLQRLDKLRDRVDCEGSYVESRNMLAPGGKLALDTIQASKVAPQQLKNRDMVNLLNRAAAALEGYVRSHDIDGQELVEDLLTTAGGLA